MSTLRAEKRRRGLTELAVLAGLAGWFGATAASQHPQRIFDRMREFDPTGLIVANWRFFAPEPARHDFHLLHRVQSADGFQGPWEETTTIAPRAAVQTVWFPGRRREKALFDLCNELLVHLGTPGLDITRSPSFALLRDFVDVTVRERHRAGPAPRGFQFLIARHTGHEQDLDPDYLLVSPFVPLAAED
ncbi:hypothetical protein CFN78_17745 [Amycolatopsis antarctica]|uniref:Uncharacterized protein n=1 Tax=Amycolatopsis antarctica TaxID=1854586 RepID=A0A263D1A1_9PSEU|nr:hypothetical protein [Amycolatopsis antarctica]OZM71979.1 hypothetical protein CFN78_17745 [Amycolatopsis antarctica]